MKKYLVVTNNEKYYLIEEKQCNFRRSFELIKNVENIIDLTKFNLED